MCPCPTQSLICIIPEVCSYSFVRQVESDMSTVGGFHLHPELGESHIHVLGSTSVSPSFANFENKFGIATDTSGPSRNSQQQGSTQPPPIAVQQQGTSRPGHNSPARGASYPPVFSSAPQDVITWPHCSCL